MLETLKRRGTTGCWLITAIFTVGKADDRAGGATADPPVVAGSEQGGRTEEKGRAREHRNEEAREEPRRYEETVNRIFKLKN